MFQRALNFAGKCSSGKIAELLGRIAELLGRIAELFLQISPRVWTAHLKFIQLCQGWHSINPLLWQAQLFRTPQVDQNIEDLSFLPA